MVATAFDTEQISEAFRLLFHLPIKANRDLVILKGHLLIEELIRKAVDRELTRPAYLKGFGFHHYLSVARALISDESMVWAWDAAKELNNIRNQIAHSLEPKELDKHVEKFTRLVEQHRSWSYPPEFLSEAGPLAAAIMTLHTVFLSHIHFTTGLRIPAMGDG